MSQAKSSYSVKYPLFVAVNNGYIVHLLTMLISLVSNNEDLISELFVMSAERITILNRLRLKVLGLILKFKVSYAIVGKSELNFQYKIHGHVGIESFLRLFIPTLCPKKYKFALYLDSDIIVNGSIVDFLEPNNINSKIIIAVEELGASVEDQKKALELNKYFNAGVLFINVERWNEIYTKEDISSWIKEFNPDKHKYWDQDILNLKIKEIDVEYKDITYNYTNINRFNTVLESPRIIHFTGTGINKPWVFGCRNPFRHIYWKYRKFVDPIGSLIFRFKKS